MVLARNLRICFLLKSQVQFSLRANLWGIVRYECEEPASWSGTTCITERIVNFVWFLENNFCALNCSFKFTLQIVFYCLKLRRIQFSKPLQIILECIYYYYKKKKEAKSLPLLFIFPFSCVEGNWKMTLKNPVFVTIKIGLLHSEFESTKQGMPQLPGSLLESIQTQGFVSMVLVRDRDWGVCSCKVSGSIFRPQGLTSIWTQGFGSMVLVWDRD